MNGLRTKSSQMLKEVAGSDANIFMLTETNLDDSMLDNELFTDNFIVFRNDRNVKNNLNNKRTGGGVLIAAA